jgi:hypothetical protein
MFSSECELLSIRPLPSTEDDFYTDDYSLDEDRVRDRTCSVTRRVTLNSTIPPSDTITQELQTYSHVIPNIFIYDRNIVRENSYGSIEDIPAVQNTECLWIDVPGVSEYFSFHVKNFILFRYMINPYYQVSVEDLRFIN